jgi:hypothetical protein
MILIKVLGLPIFILTCIGYIIRGFIETDFMELRNYIEDYWDINLRRT